MKHSEALSRRRSTLLGGTIVVLAGVLFVPFRVVAQSPAAEAREIGRAHV